jgi:hypothetical protein
MADWDLMEHHLAGCTCEGFSEGLLVLREDESFKYKQGWISRRLPFPNNINASLYALLQWLS